MREYDDRRELENIYEKVRKNIKEQIELKGVSMKGSAKGNALSEILSVFDDELGINIADELRTGRSLIRKYYSKYNDIQSLEMKYNENKRKLEEQEAVSGMVSLLTDEVLKNAIVAYNALSERRGRTDAKDIVIAYITSKGREDLKDVIDSNG